MKLATNEYPSKKTHKKPNKESFINVKLIPYNTIWAQIFLHRFTFVVFQPERINSWFNIY